MIFNGNIAYIGELCCETGLGGKGIGVLKKTPSVLEVVLGIIPGVSPWYEYQG